MDATEKQEATREKVTVRLHANLMEVVRDVVRFYQEPDQQRPANAWDGHPPTMDDMVQWSLFLAIQWLLEYERKTRGEADWKFPRRTSELRPGRVPGMSVEEGPDRKGA